MSADSPDAQPVRRFNTKPRPRALISTKNDELAEVFARSFRHSVRVTHPSDVQQREFEVLVTTQGVTVRQTEFHAPLHVLAFGGALLGRGGPAKSSVPPLDTVRRLHDASADSEFALGPELPAGIRDLVERDCVPQAKSRPRQPSVQAGLPVGRLWYSVAVLASWSPFLVSTSGLQIAGSFRRGLRGEGGECWTLPGDVKLHEEWLHAALRHWRKLDPERFQYLPGWEREDDWLTAEEATITSQVVALQRELEETRARVEARMSEMEGQLARARAAAETGARRLLTADSDELVAEVRDTLQFLGFDVQDMDASAAKGQKLEDLRVTTSDRPEWIALVEVKGYVGGAKVNDLIKIGQRFAVRFTQEAGRPPSAMWYVANTFKGQDPAGREPILSANEAELATFSEDGGLAVDTAVLFRLLRKVREGAMSRTEARRILVERTGRLEVP